MASAKGVTIFEVGPRDGLQNEKQSIALDVKLEFIRGLVDAGLPEIEVAAFVRPDRVPQMADSETIFKRLVDQSASGSHAKRTPRFWSLVPNQKGLERAIEAGALNFAVFTGATESFTQRNIGMSIRESLEEFRGLIHSAKVATRGKAKFRGYVSVALGCPFEGKVAPKQALRVIEKLGNLGVTQVSIGDTIGVGTPKSVEAVFKPAIKMLRASRVAGHFHDTRGTALANALRAYQLGVRTLDSSAGGLGGCPFAPGATGNLATEDLVYMLEGMGVRTGVDLNRLSQASLRMSHRMERDILSSRYLQAFAATLV